MIVERYVNELMTSNCYIVVDEVSKSCVVIDPGSEKSSREIEYINTRGLKPDYIIITHEHTDHNWGVNSLRKAFPDIKLVCSEECSKHIAKANKAYFLFYYDDPAYSYEVEPADILIKGQISHLDWRGHDVEFLFTPGHSFGSMCVRIVNMFFTGDTIMPYKPYFNGRDSNEEDWEISIKYVEKKIDQNTIIYPGHGDVLFFREWLQNYR
jgi:glyoxylase-like metal-dependent hydrolase (beta-lactamase superfamily II)